MSKVRKGVSEVVEGIFRVGRACQSDKLLPASEGGGPGASQVNSPGFEFRVSPPANVESLLTVLRF